MTVFINTFARATAEAPGGQEEGNIYFPQSDLGFVQYSDSLMIYTFDQSPEALRDVIVASVRLVGGLCHQGFPARGAISQGELIVTKDEKHFLGKGLIYAYDWEQRQNWAGGMLDPDQPELIERLEEKGLLDPLVQHGLLVQYDVPMKDGTSVLAWALGWPALIRDHPAIWASIFASTAGGEDEKAKAKHTEALKFIIRVMSDNPPDPDPPDLQHLLDQGIPRHIAMRMLD